MTAREIVIARSEATKQSNEIATGSPSESPRNDKMAGKDEIATPPLREARNDKRGRLRARLRRARIGRENK